jgi:DMSO/TMAO reductase YedYZ molybdopterin-dependent catalytic subunit
VLSAVDLEKQMTPISRGFHGRPQSPGDASRLPPGQHLTGDFPVLSYGPTPHTPVEEWSFKIDGAVAQPLTWSWEELLALPSEPIVRDIHCVTKWSKLDTKSRGVAIDVLLEHVQIQTSYLTAWCDGGYTTNHLLEDVTGGKAWVVYEYDGQPLPAEHGGPARLLVPHLYFWKSAKWVRGLTFTGADTPGFWEMYGYHIHGDPWKEQRYKGD